MVAWIRLLTIVLVAGTLPAMAILSNQLRAVPEPKSAAVPHPPKGSLEKPVQSTSTTQLLEPNAALNDFRQEFEALGVREFRLARKLNPSTNTEVFVATADVPLPNTPAMWKRFSITEPSAQLALNRLLSAVNDWRQRISLARKSR